MTRTEDRLMAALESAAADIDAQTMRPLASPGPSRPGLAGRTRRRPVMLAAALAAAALIAGIAAVVVPSPGPVLAAAYIGGSEAHVPAFFIDAGDTGLYQQKLRVISLTTGAVTATEHAPRGTVDAKIILLNLRTGARQVWDDRLTAGDHYPRITSGAWTPDGRALVFASHICSVADARRCSWEFRKLVAAGSRLHAGPVLLRQRGMGAPDQAPAISPHGDSVIEVRAHTGLIRMSLTTGRPMVLSPLRAPGRYAAGPNEGNFLFIGRQTHPGNDWQIAGWVAGARFHPLRYPPAH
jgi:hypothetical protein